MSRKLIIVAAIAICATSLAFAGDTVKRGAAISADTKTVALAAVLASPDKYTKDPVLVEGTIAASCTNKGCWMQLVPEEGKDGVRVTFKEYGFFIPLDAKGMHAKAEGVAVVKKLSKDDADHLAGEGAKLHRNEDGTADEITFVANGVELHR